MDSKPVLFEQLRTINKPSTVVLSDLFPSNFFELCTLRAFFSQWCLAMTSHEVLYLVT